MGKQNWKLENQLNQTSHSEVRGTSHGSLKEIVHASLWGVSLLSLIGCGASDPKFSYQYNVESFDPKAQVVTLEETSPKVDMLWVVDNSGSMNAYQNLIANAFDGFAKTYLNKDRDIRIGVITTDVYLAGQANANYGQSNGANYAKLLPGIHDGPRPPVNSGIRSGRAILETVPPEGTPADDTWFNQLIADFKINAKPGITGSGSERGIQSVDKFLSSNEEAVNCIGELPASNCFFRKNSIRAIIFLSDERDTSVFQANGQLINNTQPNLLASTLHNRLKNFFRGLDGNGDQNFFVVSIVNEVPLNGNQALWGPEYVELANQTMADTTNKAGSFSMVADINQTDYTAILDKIGQSIDAEIEERARSIFSLGDYPESKSDVKVTLLDEGGQQVEIPSDQFSISGKALEIKSPGFPGNVSLTAVLEVEYLPLLGSPEQ